MLREYQTFDTTVIYSDRTLWAVFQFLIMQITIGLKVFNILYSKHQIYNVNIIGHELFIAT